MLNADQSGKQADMENRISYLECSNPRNLKLYKRLGFELVKKINLVRSEKPVELEIMTRLPVAQKLAGKTSNFVGERGAVNYRSVVVDGTGKEADCSLVDHRLVERTDRTI